MINLKTIESLLCEEIRLSDELLSCRVDNRNLNSKDLFIAIVGDKYNPLEHIQKIIDSGCLYVLYEKNENTDKLVKPFESQIKFLPVNDLIKAIGQVGQLVSEQFKERGGKVIAISGSNGKTTTKEMLFHLLTNSYGDNKVICTQKNNNNHLGVPFTLYQITQDTQFAIVELGSNAPGEIEYLCKMIKANIGVTTNIGDTHLEFFETRENVFNEEGILSKYCSEIFFVNADDEYLKQITSCSNMLTFGIDGKNYKFQFSANGLGINNSRIHNTFITGKHNFQNLGLAFSIAHFINPDRCDDFLQAAQTFEPTSNRSEWIQIRNTKTFLDAYNANPSSMKAALEGFSDYLEQHNSKNSEACVILGDMNELGINSDAMHADVGKFAINMDFAEYVFIGRFREEYTKTALQNIHKFETTQHAITFLSGHLDRYKYMFVKGSRSLQLERITDIK